MTLLRRARGQSLVEFALVAPLFILVLAGIMTLGVGVFYQQQLSNAAREAARYAAIHSATSQCPTRSWISPNLNQLPVDFELDTYQNCDPPSLGWPQMTAHARSKVFGIDASQVYFAACWSGYWDNPPGTTWSGPQDWDAPAIGADGQANAFYPCRIGGIDPRTETSSLPCPPPATVFTSDPQTTDDTASNLAATAAFTTNQVTVYACYEWTPPFISDLWGGTITLRAVITEAMQHQR
jgi:hypothetical protein